MHFYNRNILTMLGFVLILACVLQMAPGTNADCAPESIKKECGNVCKYFPWGGLLCKQIIEQVVAKIDNICQTSSTTTVSTTTTSTTAPTTTTSKP